MSCWNYSQAQIHRCGYILPSSSLAVQKLNLPSFSLAIKSARVDSSDTRSSSESDSSPSHAVLCTPDKTFHLRQVQTSNSVFIAQPTPFQDDAASIPNDGIMAVAQCSATLELIPSEDSALPYLKKLLPLWTKDRTSVTDSPRSKHDVLSDIPLSDAEIEIAWTQLCAFELGTTRPDGSTSGFRPASSDLLEFWKAICAASYAEAIPLDDPLDPEVVWRLVSDEGYPRPFFYAVMRRLVVQANAPVDTAGGKIRIGHGHCARWTAALVLETQARSAEGLPEGRFLEQWRDLLPEDWRANVSMASIEDLFGRPAPGMVMAKGSAAQADPGNSGPRSKARRWHDKFRGSRR